MPIEDECCFRCIECHNVRCYDDGDRGCIHGQPICDRCFPGDCPECQDEAERRIAEDAPAGLDAAAAKWLARDPFYRPSDDTDPWRVNPTHPEQRYNAAYHAARKES